MLPRARLVRFDMLDVIEHLNHEQRELLGQHVEEQRLAPIEQQYQRHEAEEHEVLACCKPELAAILVPQLAKKPLDVGLLIDGRVYQQRQQVVSLEKNRRPAAVPLSIVVPVMI